MTALYSICPQPRLSRRTGRAAADGIGLIFGWFRVLCIFPQIIADNGEFQRQRWLDKRLSFGGKVVGQLMRDSPGVIRSSDRSHINHGRLCVADKIGIRYTATGDGVNNAFIDAGLRLRRLSFVSLRQLLLLVCVGVLTVRGCNNATIISNAIIGF